MQQWGKRLTACLLAVAVSVGIAPMAYAADAKTLSINEQTFPDEHLREAVSQGDYDGDGVLNEFELNDLTYLYVSDAESLEGIQHLPALTDLNISGFYIKSLDFGIKPNLKDITVSTDSLESIDVSNNINLEYLSVSAPKLTSIDIANNDRLNYLYISSAQIDEIDLANNTELTNLSLSLDSLKHIDLSSQHLLRDFSLSSNHLDTLDLSSMTQLNELSLDLPSDIQGFQLPKTDTLTSFYLTYDGDIGNVNFASYPHLETLDIEDAETDDIDLSTNKALTDLSLRYMTIRSPLDLTGNTSLARLNLYNIEEIPTLALPDGDTLQRASISWVPLLSLTLKNKPANGAVFDSGVYRPSTSDGTFDIASVDPNFDPSKVSNLKKATLTGTVLTLASDYSDDYVSYDYDAGFGFTYPVEIYLTNYSSYVPVDSIDVICDGATNQEVSLRVGAWKQLSTIIKPENASNQYTYWESADPSVARIGDYDGLLAGVAPGTTRITAQCDGKERTITVHVLPAVTGTTVDSVAVSGTGVSGGKASINVGAKLNLIATVQPATSGAQVQWASSDADVALVSSTGQVHAVAPGTATITATAGGKSASVTVTVLKAVSVDSLAITGPGVANNKLSLAQNKTAQLSVKVSPSNAVVGPVYWSSSDTAVATVDGNGKVTAKSEGITAISVGASDKSAAIVLTVTKDGGAADRFKDVPAGTMFHDEIEWLASVGVTKGNSDGTYGYADSLNRRDMAIFLYRLAKVHGVGDAASYVPSDADYARFSDVRRGDFGAVEILWMASHGIANGTDGRYEGLKTLNRRDMAIFLARYARLAGVEGAGSYRPSAAEYGRFSDVSEGMFGAEEILWMAKVGITNGNADGSFGAYGDMQRHAMAAFLYRLDKLVA
ncbi:Ig-like domain-containing protein [Bifidobacterium criceti]|uniref:Alpha-amylase n=1 Tax=Bifidobacterium criceti TaxID=1960969 RepID=A0A2A2EI00_9BIFI|nr:Ig-like domain-containing protein [Bifidobacterium criceti]PAU68631.1 alpha-amylase [Bifidobacterium criceti]